jgi:hypothetical protein
MRSGYQHDFVDSIADRTRVRATKDQAETARFAKGDQKSAAKWLETRTNPLLAPAKAKQAWIVGDRSKALVEVKPLWHMKRFSNVSAKTATGKVKRTPPVVASGYLRKDDVSRSSSPAGVAAVAASALPSNQRRSQVPPPQAAAKAKVSTPPPLVSTQPW